MNFKTYFINKNNKTLKFCTVVWKNWSDFVIYHRKFRIVFHCLHC